MHLFDSAFPSTRRVVTSQYSSISNRKEKTTSSVKFNKYFYFPRIQSLKWENEITALWNKSKNNQRINYTSPSKNGPEEISVQVPKRSKM